MRIFRLRALLIACLSFLPLAMFAQPDTWVRSIGSASSEIPGGLITDANGYIYVSGNFKDTIDVGGTLLHNAGENDFFVAKFKPNGDLVWTQRFGWTGSEYIGDMALDGLGNLYIQGHYQDSTALGPDTIYTGNPGGNFDMFVVRLDTAGNYFWHMSNKGLGGEFSHGIEADGKGNVYFTGRYRLETFFFQNSLKFFAEPALKGLEDVYLGRMDSNKTIIWYRSFGGEFNENVFDLTLHEDSILYLTGYFQDSTYFDDSTTYIVGDQTENLYVVKYDTAGNYRWARTGLQDDKLVRGTGITTDANDNIYVTGIFDSTFSYQGGTPLTGVGELDGFVLSLNSNGNLNWSKTIGGTGFDGVRAIDINSSGALMLTGYFQDQLIVDTDTLQTDDPNDSQVFVASLSDAGNSNWLNSGGGVSLDEGHFIACDPFGSSIVMGIYTGTASFGQVSLNSSGGDDIFIFKINSVGQVDRDPAITQYPTKITAFPNPSAGPLGFRFAMEQAGPVKIEIMDIQGRSVANSGTQNLSAGVQTLRLDLSNLPGGVYLYRAQVGAEQFSGKIILR